MLPPGFPSDKTAQRRLKLWLQQEAFGTAWEHLAQRYETLPGINWDDVRLDGSKKPAKKGVSRPGRAPWTAANVGRQCT